MWSGSKKRNRCDRKIDVDRRTEEGVMHFCPHSKVNVDFIHFFRSAVHRTCCICASVYARLAFSLPVPWWYTAGTPDINKVEEGGWECWRNKKGETGTTGGLGKWIKINLESAGDKKNIADVLSWFFEVLGNDDDDMIMLGLDFRMRNIVGYNFFLVRLI